MSKLTLCILFGGASSEYEVSCVSAYSVITAADPEKYDIVLVGATRDGRFYLYEGGAEDVRDDKWAADPSRLTPVSFALDGSRNLLPEGGAALKIDVAFPVMHGAFGEDGKIQGMLALAGIPCVGAGCASSAACMDKWFTKCIVAATGVEQAKALLIVAGRDEDGAPTLPANAADMVEREIGGYPVFVKPARAGSSVGVGKAKDRAGLIDALKAAAAHDPRIVVEEYIKGAEVECAVWGNGDVRTTAPGEIDPGAEFYDYDTKYKNDTARYYVPARITPEQTKTLRRAAAAVYRALDCRGFARVDFFAAEDGRIIFNEINTIPGFTPISMFPKLWMRENGTYSQLVDALVALALTV